MRRAVLATALIVALIGSASAESLTPARCREIANSIGPMLTQFDGLDRVVRTIDTAGIAKAAKGRLQEAAEEVPSAQTEFLRAAGAYRSSLAFLFNELKNCQNGETLPRAKD